MLRLRGRCLRGIRLIDHVPHGHWKTITFIAGLRRRAMVARAVIWLWSNGPGALENIVSRSKRMFAIGAGYHRYFSHRAYRTSRPVQFVLAFLSQSSAQKSVLWWAAKHRHHHLFSDSVTDVHSPRHKGFLYSHLGWIFARSSDALSHALS